MQPFIILMVFFSRIKLIYLLNFCCYLTFINFFIQFFYNIINYFLFFIGVIKSYRTILCTIIRMLAVYCCWIM